MLSASQFLEAMPGRCRMMKCQTRVCDLGREVSVVLVEGMACDWKAGHRSSVKALLMPLADLDSFDSSICEQQVHFWNMM